MLVHVLLLYLLFFFFNDTATTEIYTLSLHDALPIYRSRGDGHPSDRHLRGDRRPDAGQGDTTGLRCRAEHAGALRSEEHTSELQSLAYLVCRLLLEKKKARTHPRNRTVTGPHPPRDA